MLTRLALSLYRCLLAFYPAGFRAEFGPEMMSVFSQAWVVQRGPALAGFCWRELRDWPGLVWRIHQAERSQKMAKTGSLQAQPASTYPLVPAGTWREAWLAALSFLLIFWEPAGWAILGPVRELFNLTYTAQGQLYGVILLAIIAFDLVMVVLGWRRGWPRWCLPYLGIVLTVVIFLVLAGLTGGGELLIFSTPPVFLLILLVVALGRRWKVLHSLYERVRGEWTLLGLAYYCCLPVVFVLMLDETRYETSIELVLYALLALGVAAYIRSASLWQRVIVLPGAFVAASLVAAALYRNWQFVSRRLWLTSDAFRLLTGLEVLAIVPLLIVGILELWRYGFAQRLQAV
jgi:hypothetical protein